MAVVGPLAAFAEPHSYDLCEEHAVRLTVPRGWEVVRHVGEFPSPIPHADDLEALADAVREAARVEVPRELRRRRQRPDRPARPPAGGTAAGLSSGRRHASRNAPLGLRTGLRPARSIA